MLDAQDKVVGFMSCFFFDNGKKMHQQCLRIDPSSRRRGLGRSFFKLSHDYLLESRPELTEALGSIGSDVYPAHKYFDGSFGKMIAHRGHLFYPINGSVPKTLSSLRLEEHSVQLTDITKEDLAEILFSMEDSKEIRKRFLSNGYLVCMWVSIKSLVLGHYKLQPFSPCLI